MTKISTYVVDDKVTALDKWIGSDANMQNKTKNFTPKKLAAYFNENQVINIGTPLQYKYYTLDPLEPRPNGTLTFETEIGPTVNFSSVTSFILSKYTTKQNIVSDFLNFLDGSKVLLFKSSDINSFGFYRISDIAIYDEDPNFFIVTVDYETGNGFMQEDEDYMISLVSLAGEFIPTKTSELINDGDDGVNPFISELDINRTEWDAAYEGKINSAEVTGDTTKTLTLTKQDGSTIEASWTDDNTDAVISVFGRTGDVVAESGDYTTDQVAEVANKKYQTDDQALYNDATSSIQDQLDSKQGSITLTTTGTSGAATLIGDTLNIPQYSVDLSGFVPYTGANNNVFLGEHGIGVGYVTFDTTPTNTPTDQGTMYWDDTKSTVSLIMNGTIQHIGQDSFYYAKNSSGSSIPKGTAVRFAGTDGASGHILIDAMIANGTVPSSYYMGITSETIANGDFGQVVAFGELEGVNTSAYTAGSLLYVSTTVAGGFQTSVPVAPNNIILAAATLNSKNNGSLIVRATLGSNINSDEGVNIISPTTGDLLQLQSNGLWENKSVASLGLVSQSRTLTINGTAFDLSVNRSWNVGTVTSVGLISGTSGVTIGSSPITTSGNITLAIATASGSQQGLLSSTDWNTFNNKQAAGNYITSLTGEATASGPGAAAITLNNASVTGKLLTGVNITGGTVLSTDTMLTAFGKLQNQINSLIGGSIYQGVWNANTNTPTLTSSVGTDGNYYIVNVAGSTNLNGITDWKIGDWAIFHGGTWQKVDNTESVSSVNGQTGAVSLTTDNISEGSANLYFTNSRSRSALSFTAGSGAYNSTTGVITIPTNTSQLTNGANYITLASLSGTTPIGYNNTTGAISITQSGTASDGYLSSTDWNTFNNKTSNVGTVTSVAAITLGTTGTDLSSTVANGTTTPVITLNVPTASATNRGVLSSADWTTFNNKQNALTNPITGTGTTNYLPKFTGSTALGNSLIYDNGTNIGIGTSSPSYKLDVAGVGRFLGTIPLTLERSGSTKYTFSLGASDDFYINNVNIGSTPLTILSSGNVGIGTTSPSGKLHVEGLSYFGSDMFTAQNGGIFFDGYASYGSGIFGRNFGDDLAMNAGGSERMRITSGGNVGIGTTSPLAKLDVNGQVRVTDLTLQGFYQARTSDTAGSGVFGGNSFVLRNGATSEDLNFDVFNRTSSAWYTPIIIKNTGNVGIGTSSPTKKLHVKGGNDNVLFLDNGGEQYTTQYFANNGTTKAFLVWDNTNSLFQIGTAVASDLPFLTNNTERMRITSGGNVGIGTTSPLTALTVSGNLSLFTTNQIRLYNSAKNNWAEMSSPLLGGDTEIDFKLVTKSGVVYVNPTGSVGIGTTSPSFQLQLSNDSAAKPGSPLWTVSSDIRIKENVRPYTDGLEKLMQVNPVYYDYNGKAGFSITKDNVGIIAQEMQEVLPNTIKTFKAKLNDDDEEETELLSFNANEIIYVLINSVKELKAEIEILKNK